MFVFCESGVIFTRTSQAYCSGWSAERSTWHKASAQEMLSAVRLKVKALVAQSCLILCNPVDCSPPGSLSMEFSRQEQWSGQPFPSPGDLPDPQTELGSPALKADSFCEPPRKPIWLLLFIDPGAYALDLCTLECKRRKPRNTWSNGQIWPWSTEWSRANANRVLPRECTGHSKHALPTTQGKTLHMNITRWLTPQSDWLYSLQPKMEKLYTVSKNKTGSWLWLRSWTPYCQIQT